MYDGNGQVRVEQVGTSWRTGLSDHRFLKGVTTRMHYSWLWQGLAIVSLVSCSGAGGGPPASPAVPNPVTILPSDIKHVVLIVQENHSFDSLFGAFPGADGATTGKTSTGATIPLATVTLEAGIDIDHSHNSFLTEYDNGKMDGFDNIHEGGEGNLGPAGDYPYAEIEQSEIVPYWTMAREYTLADHMFQTQSSGSYTAHQDLIAGTTQYAPGTSMIDFPSAFPWGCDAPTGTTVPSITSSGVYIPKSIFPCVNYETLATTLDDAGVSWRYYAPQVNPPSGPVDAGADLWSAFDSIKSVRYGPDWSSDISSPPSNVLADIANGRLAQMSWVIPDFLNSDHPLAASNTGPAWVSSIVNAIGASKYWNSTAIIIVWDDWGGWYDNVPPPQLDYDGLGFRVPMIVVSPWARRGYISHTQYEFGSILEFVEQTFNVPSLGTTDARATSILDCFDFTQAPRLFTAIPSSIGRRFFLNQRPSYHVVDDE